MESSNQPLGLILRIRPWRESDLLLDMFSDQHGRITALAKGGRRSLRRFSGQLITGQLLSLDLQPGKNSDLWLLKQTGLLATYLGLREDYRRWLAAGPVLETLLRGTAPGHCQPMVLYLALISLKRLALSQNRQERQTALLIYLNRFLQEIGFALYLDACLLCGKSLEQTPASLSLQGGAICLNCLSANAVAPRGLISSLRAAQKMPLDALNRLGFTKTSLPLGLEFISNFARSILAHDLPSLDFIDYY